MGKLKTEGKSYCYQRNEFSTLWDSTYTCTCTLLYTSVAIMKRSSYSICKEAVSSGSVLAKQRLSPLCKYLQIALIFFLFHAAGHRKRKSHCWPGGCCPPCGCQFMLVANHSRYFSSLLSTSSSPGIIWILYVT